MCSLFYFLFNDAERGILAEPCASILNHAMERKMISNQNLTVQSFEVYSVDMMMICHHMKARFDIQKKEHSNAIKPFTLFMCPFSGTCALEWDFTGFLY